MKTNLHFGPDGILTILIAEKKSWFDFWTFFADSVKPLWH